MVLIPRPGQDGPNQSGWYRRLREPILPFSMFNSVQLWQLFSRCWTIFLSTVIYDLDSRIPAKYSKCQHLFLLNAGLFPFSLSEISEILYLRVSAQRFEPGGFIEPRRFRIIFPSVDTSPISRWLSRPIWTRYRPQFYKVGLCPSPPSSGICTGPINLILKANVLQWRTRRIMQTSPESVVHGWSGERNFNTQNQCFLERIRKSQTMLRVSKGGSYSVKNPSNR